MIPVEIFVFGSNEQGKHGKGAALAARQYHGAIQGRGEGFQGNSYAIPTKSTPWRKLPLDRVQANVNRFIARARHTPQFTYNVTAIGCGLAGHTPEEIAPMFREALKLDHVRLPQRFLDIIAPGSKGWTL